MGMSAAKHTDMIVGMDMHMILPPPPAPPVMVPHPVAGMIMDPADYAPGACTVYVNGLPRARAGNLCMMIPPHIPIGGMFMKPPLSEVEIYQGSSSVTADGEALSALNHQVLGCHDIGAPAPVRRWKSGGAKSLMKAGSVIIAAPAGAPVMVGGAPATSASGGDSSSLEAEEPERQTRFIFFFEEPGSDLASTDVSIEIDGAPHPDVTRTGPRGEVDLLVPLDASEAVITFRKGTETELRWTLALHQLADYDTDKGFKERLANLGFLASAESSDEDVVRASLLFRMKHGLEIAGGTDGELRRAVRDAHKG
jgi:uncharacterized Zn-binding protein involved in type VI secretion